MATGASAFLLFQVQPILSKALLPSFGGSPSVWTACLVFFQTMLLAGYALAHGAARWPRCGVGALLGLSAVALLVLPVDPTTDGAGSTHEVAAIVAALGGSVGLPFLLLATAAPTLQRWHAATSGGATTYRLYAVSNVGALLALISYPFFWEARYGVDAQLRMWSVAFGCFAAVYAVLGLRLARGISPVPRSTTESAGAAQYAWIVLPALTSALLMAVTEHVCRELTVVPFLWVVPLALYLLSFAMAFSGDEIYSPVQTSLAVCVLLAVLSLAPDVQRWLRVYLDVRMPLVNLLDSVETRSTLYLAFFFASAFFCHAELYRRRPPTSDLTRYYLAISAGGALGGTFVAVICPLVFSDFYELPLLSLTIFTLAAMAVVRRAVQARSTGLRVVTALLCVAVVATIGRAEFRPLTSQPRGSLATRTFHGVLRVVAGIDTSDGSPFVALYHGGVLHGLQYTAADRRSEPTTYYSRDSGAGIAIETLARSRSSLHVGVIGLGAGTLAAYERPADTYRFYELDGAVAELAASEFDFLSDAPGKTDIEIGDGRLLLEREEPAGYDLLLIDAFSGDSVPAHLLTREAFALYLRHVTDDGVIGVHVSNRHLRLARVVFGAAAEFGLAAAQISTDDGDDDADAGSDWVLVSRDRATLQQFATATLLDDDIEPVVWTDQRSDLFAILR